MLKPPLKYKILIVVILLFNITFGQTELIQELDKNIIEIKTISPDSSFADINELLPILKNIKIIGLGEATHGTHDFFVYKHRLVKLLAKQANYKIIIIEGDFTGSQIMNDYVLYGKGTLNKALFSVGYGVWMTKEFGNLIKWVKKYNSNKKDEEKMKFYGCDIQNAVLTAQKVEEYLEKNGELDTVTKNGLNWIISHKYLTENKKKDKLIVDKFLTKLDYTFNNLANEKTDNEFLLIEHSKRELEQIIEVIFAKSSESVLLRDKFMAENIEWIYNFEKKQKVIFWAHNEHIANNTNKTKQKPAGYYLKNTFRTEYYAFGFGFFNGKNRTYSGQNKEWIVNTIPDVSISESTDAIFSQCQYENFILDLKSVNNNKIISSFMNSDLYHRSIGAKYYPENNKMRNYSKSKLIESFDGIIFFRNTKPSEGITNE